MEEAREVRLDLPAEPASVTAARRACAALAKDVGVDPFAVRVAASELVGNSAVHAYDPEARGKISVLARWNGDRLVITVADGGRGMRPRPDSPGLGLGLPLVGRVADVVEIDSRGGGCSISVSFAAARLRSRQRLADDPARWPIVQRKLPRNVLVSPRTMRTSPSAGTRRVNGPG